MLAGDRQTDRLQWTAAEFQTLPLPADGAVLHGHHGGSEGMCTSEVHVTLGCLGHFTTACTVYIAIKCL